MVLTRVIVLEMALAFGMPESASPQLNPTLTEFERGIRGDRAEDAAHLRIDELRVDAQLAGRAAAVTVEMLIASDRPDPYEGDLALALPADAVVTDYALDVEGAMIPGQLLEAPKARKLYEDEVCADVDPGLAEVAGHRFTTRIYPIDAAHPRCFRLHFVSPFDPVKGIALPLGRDAAIGRVAVSVAVDGHAAPPAVRFAGRPVAVARDGSRWVGRAAAEREMLRDGLVIEGGAPSGALTVAKHADGKRFFVIDDGDGAAPKPPVGGAQLRIHWDRSVSHRDAPLDLEAEVLARLVDRVAPIGTDLVTFASDRPEVATVADAAGLRVALGRVAYRGGTSFKGLDALALPAARTCVLVSDGRVTIDKGAGFSPDCRRTMLTAAVGGRRRAAGADRGSRRRHRGARGRGRDRAGCGGAGGL